MRHLEPDQIDAVANKRRPLKQNNLLWIASMLTACIVLGASSTTWFAPGAQDLVANTEKQERQLAFTKVSELRVSEVEASKIDTALNEMMLPPNERAQMRSLLAPAASTNPTIPGGGAVSSPVLRLVSISLWDTHAEDGDVVAVVGGGYRREIVLTKTIQTIAFPVDRLAMVEIVGVRDGGGGITLGIRGSSQEILMPIMSEGQTLSLPLGR